MEKIGPYRVIRDDNGIPFWAFSLPALHIYLCRIGRLPRRLRKWLKDVRIRIEDKWISFTIHKRF